MDKVKPGDIFVHTVRMVGDTLVGYDESANGPMPEEVKRKLREGPPNPDRIEWYLAIHYDTSLAPEDGKDWVGIPVKMLRNVAAVGSNGKQYWLSNLPCKVADSVSFVETGEIKAMSEMEPGQLFILGEEILMKSHAPGVYFSMSGVCTGWLPQGVQCPVVKLKAEFDLEGRVAESVTHGGSQGSKTRTEAEEAATWMKRS